VPNGICNTTVSTLFTYFDELLKVENDREPLEQVSLVEGPELIDLRPCQHDNGYMNGRSQIKVHTCDVTNRTDD